MRGLNPRSDETYTVVLQVVASHHVFGRRSISCEAAGYQHVDVNFKKHREHTHGRFQLSAESMEAELRLSIAPVS